MCWFTCRYTEVTISARPLLAMSGQTPPKTQSKPKKTNVSGRSYKEQDLKMLYARSAGLCAYPACFKQCIQNGVAVDKVVMVGEIAHIRGVKPGSSRHDPNMSPEDRDAYSNLVLMCKYCHPVIDEKVNGQPKYSVITIEKWKQQLESWVLKKLETKMPTVTSDELEQTTIHLRRKAGNASADFTIVNPQQKLDLNGFTDFAKQQLQIGLGKVEEVAKFVEHMGALESTFPEALKAGFIEVYDQCLKEGYTGDGIFNALVCHASGHSDDLQKQAAGLAVVVYYFERCEIFKKS